MKKEILYQKIARTIAWQIKNGVWKVGEKLPSLRTFINISGTFAYKLSSGSYSSPIGILVSD